MGTVCREFHRYTLSIGLHQANMEGSVFEFLLHRPFWIVVSGIFTWHSNMPIHQSTLCQLDSKVGDFPMRWKIGLSRIPPIKSNNPPSSLNWTLKNAIIFGKMRGIEGNIRLAECIPHVLNIYLGVECCDQHSSIWMSLQTTSKFLLLVTFSRYPPNVHNVATSFHPVDSEFSQLLSKTGMYRNYSLNTGMDHSPVWRISQWTS